MIDRILDQGMRALVYAAGLSLLLSPLGAIGSIVGAGIGIVLTFVLY